MEKDNARDQYRIMTSVRQMTFSGIRYRYTEKIPIPKNTVFYKNWPVRYRYRYTGKIPIPENTVSTFSVYRPVFGIF